MPPKLTPPTRFEASYDCELPEDARRELGEPKRAAILRRPVYQPSAHSSSWKWIGAFALTVIVLAGVIGHYTQQQQHAPAVTPVQPAPTLIVPAPAPPVISQPASPLAPIQSAPKATLIGVPIPAAAILFPPGRTPMWRQTAESEWTIWQPGNLDYIYIVDAQCTVSRADAIGKRVNNFAPRAERVPAQAASNAAE